MKHKERKLLGRRTISAAWGNANKRCPPSLVISKEKARLKAYPES